MISLCRSPDVDRNGHLSIVERIAAVQNALAV
jgi:hypothetical protein